MNGILSDVYYYTGRIFYWLNGGCEKMLNKSWADKVCFYFWANAWWCEEKHAGRLPK